MTLREATAGLSSAEVRRLQEQYGKNELTRHKKGGLLRMALHVVSEPMFLLLILSAAIYFVLGEPRDGSVMLIFVMGVVGIDIAQEWKTDKTLKALRELSAPQITVIRDGVRKVIASSDLVPGDLMLLFEGVKVPADGYILQCSDLCVDESSLTGESEGVWKCAVADGVWEEGPVTAAKAAASNLEPVYWRRDYCYAGTLVIQGSAAVRVDKIGADTVYGRIGREVAAAPREKTPLQKQTGKLVRTCAVIAGILFFLVGLVTWFNLPDHSFRERLIESVLSGITLAMAMIPEEFPVILTVFLAMGAWRLARKNALVSALSSAETLGSVSVLCVDKTGTVTMNRMAVQRVWAPDGDETALCEIMGLGCETDTYDPMETAILAHCSKLGVPREHLFGGELVREYAFTSELKMMGHVWRHEGELIICAKGSAEGILPLCELDAPARERIGETILDFSREGLRVIAAAEAKPESESDIPAKLTDCRLKFRGLIGLADPPRENIGRDVSTCSRAGIRVVMITGDNGVTAASVARKIGIPNCENILTGEELESMTDAELREAVKTVGIFSRVVPEHKMRIVRALQMNGETVAMTGDGVNDAPALKYADIGIAMGKRGSEVSREAADLILLDDNFSTIVETVADGRRIYDNIRKAVGYVFAIHIPIFLSSLLAPLLGISPSALMLLPLHVVLLELIIDPTCSVVLERQPAESDIMERAPRRREEKLLTAGSLLKSAVQGLAIFLASFGAYYVTLGQGPADVMAPQARAMGLAVIMLANLFLMQVNCSDRDFAIQSAARLAGDKVMWAANVGTVALLLIILYTPLGGFLKLAPLTPGQLLCALGLAAVSVIWFELVKLYRHIHN